MGTKKEDLHNIPSPHQRPTHAFTPPHALPAHLPRCRATMAGTGTVGLNSTAMAGLLTLNILSPISLAYHLRTGWCHGATDMGQGWLGPWAAWPLPCLLNPIQWPPSNGTLAIVYSSWTWDTGTLSSCRCLALHGTFPCTVYRKNFGISFHYTYAAFLNCHPQPLRPLPMDGAVFIRFVRITTLSTACCSEGVDMSGGFCRELCSRAPHRAMTLCGWGG